METVEKIHSSIDSAVDRLKDISINYIKQSEEPIDDVYSDGRYKFIMPEGDVLIARDYPW